MPKEKKAEKKEPEVKVKEETKAKEEPKEEEKPKESEEQEETAVTFKTADFPEFTMTSKAGDLIDLISAIKPLITEGNFEVSEKGLALRQMDASRVAMIVFVRPPNRWDEFEVKKQGRIAIDIENLLKILKRTRKDDKVVLKLNGDTGKLDVHIHGKYDRVFNMPVLEAGMEEVPVPKIELTTSFKLESAGLQKAIEDANIVSDHVKIITSEEGISLKASGDVSGVDINLVKGDNVTLDIFTKEKTSATYSLSYLSEIAKVGKQLSDIVTLSYSKDLPCKIEYGEEATYWLAPRIETE